MFTLDFKISSIKILFIFKNKYFLIITIIVKNKQINEFAIINAIKT